MSEEDMDDSYPIRRILRELTTKGVRLFLIDWEGRDVNGEAFEPSWEPEENVTQDAITEWEEDCGMFFNLDFPVTRIPVLPESSTETRGRRARRE